MIQTFECIQDSWKTCDELVKSFNEMSLGIELNQIVARCVKDRNQGHRLLGPVNVTLDLEASWSEDQILPIVTVQVQSDSLNILLGSQSLRTLAVIASKMIPSNKLEDDLKNNQKDASGCTTVEVDHNVLVEVESTNTEQHYVE